MEQLGSLLQGVRRLPRPLGRGNPLSGSEFSG